MCMCMYYFADTYQYSHAYAMFNQYFSVTQYITWNLRHYNLDKVPFELRIMAGKNGITLETQNIVNGMYQISNYQNI